MATTNRDTVIGGAAWRFAERIFAQLITFLVSIILARLLSPDEYGLIAIVSVFITIANVFVSDGLAAALIQKKEIDRLDYSTVLYGGFLISLFLYGVLFFCAPLVVIVYDDPILMPVLRVLSLRIPLAAIHSVESAYLSRNLQFKKFFFATFFGTALSGVIGIAMAYMGCGIWSLVGQNLVNYTTDVVILALVIKKIPPIKISIQRMKLLFSFGGNILVTNLIFQFINQLRTLVIGKKYSASDLSYYTKGLYFPNLIGQNISSPLSSVLFPTLSRMQSDIDAIRSFLRKSIHFITFVVTPLLLGLAAVSQPLVLLLLTEKWLPCVPFIWFGAIYHSFTIIHGTNLEAVKAIGAGGQVLKYGNIKRLVSFGTLLATFWISVEAIAVGLITSAVICTCINAYQNKKLFHYSYKDQFADIFPNMGVSWAMCLLTFSIGNILALHPFIELSLQVVFGVIFYVLASVLTKNKSFVLTRNILVTKLRRK